MDKETALKILRELHDKALFSERTALETFFPELKESEDERIRKELIRLLNTMTDGIVENYTTIPLRDFVAWLEKQAEPQDKGEISDGYHTFNELYYYRMLYNAAFFNMLPKDWVHKSKRHNDGEECFGGGWFIVMANLPTGQISNHYELKDWDLFQIPEKEIADKWDGHTPQEAADRLHKYLLEKQGDINETINRDKFAQGVLKGAAINLITWIDYNAAEGNMCLSNMECEDIEDALISGNWDKIYAYIKKKLERQGEQKPATKIEPKFHESEWVFIEEVKGYKNGPFQIKTVDSFGYSFDEYHTIPFMYEDILFKWTIQDARDGDVLVASDDSIFLFKCAINCACKHYVALTTKNVIKFNEGLKHYWETSTAVHPATKEQRDLLFREMKEAGYKWDNEKKELKKRAKPVE